MGVIEHKLERTAFATATDIALHKVKKDREKGFQQMYGLAEHFIKETLDDNAMNTMKEVFTNPENKWNQYLCRMLDEVDPHVAKMTLLNFGYEAFLHGTQTIRKSREKYQCNVPWLILMDPTSACNLKCTGCWAAEYGHKLNLTFEEIDSIITQGKALGIYYYMYTGGEPLVRKKDLIRICEKHNDCMFHAFTNGTLVDQEFCDEMKRVGNLMLAISLEGFEEVNNLRRGDGVFEKVMNSFKLLKKNGLIFGTSICYTAANVETVTSDEFLDMIIEKGARFSMYFHYMPVGNDASVDLMPSKEQREYMYHRVREIRGKKGKKLFTMDFQNDGEFVGGCIAGGRNYFHINANGDAEPCVFIHYSGANIRENTIVECLQQPLFMAYRDGQPFNKNHLRPCPMLENPEILQAMIGRTGAKSTDLQSPESVEHLCGKCTQYATDWKTKADEIWKNTQHKTKKYENYK